MVGDQADFVTRILAVLPKRWFGDNSPRLSALVNALAIPWVFLYDLLQYVKAQSRISTATDDWLSLVALDFFGRELARIEDEGDGAYRIRIENALLQTAASRGAVASGLANLSGTIPTIFEPSACHDTGGYGGLSGTAGGTMCGLAYGATGGWGNLSMPGQFFITVTRGVSVGLSRVGGYGVGMGGYGHGSYSYINLLEIPGRVTDQDIQRALVRLLPVNATAWLRIN